MSTSLSVAHPSEKVNVEKEAEEVADKAWGAESEPNDTGGSLTYEDPIMSPGLWTHVYDRIVKDASLSKESRLLYILVCSFADKPKKIDHTQTQENAWPGQVKLCVLMGWSPDSTKTLRRYLNELKAADLMTWKQPGLTKPNNYIISRIPERYLRALPERVT